MVFSRIQADGFAVNHDTLCGQYASAEGSHCVILCGGPSLKPLVNDLIRRDSELDEVISGGCCWFSVNCAHESLYWLPDFWTSFDWPARFDEQVSRTPRTFKFIPSFRSHELATEHLQAHELPNAVFCEIAEKTYSDFFGSGPIVDAQDSMLQAIDIAIRLGFKNLYLAGTDLYVPMSPQQEEWFKDHQPDFVQCDIVNSLWETLVGLARSEVMGSAEGDISPADREKLESTAKGYVEELDRLPSEDIYSFGQAGTSLFSRIQADHHYRISSSRLTKARRCLDRLGVKVSLLKPLEGSPGAYKSRLDGWFPSCSTYDLPVILKSTNPDYTRRGTAVRNDLPSRGKPQENVKNG